MVCRQDPAAETVEEARHAQRLGDCPQFGGGARPVDIAADDERGTLGGGDQLGELTNQIRIRVLAVPNRVVEEVELALRGPEDIEREVEERRTTVWLHRQV